MIAGSILILASAVLFAAIWIAGRSGEAPIFWPMLAVGFVGVLMFAWGLATDGIGNTRD